MAHRGLAREGATIHITTVSRCPRDLDGVTVHRARRLDPADVTRVDGLPLTSLSRTLLDLAEAIPHARFEAIFEEADRRELLDWNDLHACAARNPGHRGLRPYLSLIAAYQPTPGAEKGIEREFQLLLCEEGLPLPECNVMVAGHKVDCYWPATNFVVELDSRPTTPTGRPASATWSATPTSSAAESRPSASPPGGCGKSAPR